jgi:hypothetical protein
MRSTHRKLSSPQAWSTRRFLSDLPNALHDADLLILRLLLEAPFEALIGPPLVGQSVLVAEEPLQQISGAVELNHFARLACSS